MTLTIELPDTLAAEFAEQIKTEVSSEPISVSVTPQ